MHPSVSGAVLGIPWNSTTVNLQPTNINYRILSTTYTFDTVYSVSVADNHFGIWALFLSVFMILNRRMATDLVFDLISSNLFSFTIWYFQFCSWYLGEVHLLCIVTTKCNAMVKRTATSFYINKNKMFGVYLCVSVCICVYVEMLSECLKCYG